MRISGWIFMLVSWAVILSLFIFSMVRTLKGGDGEQEEQSPQSTD